jgi:hypothetical protein
MTASRMFFKFLRICIRTETHRPPPKKTFRQTFAGHVLTHNFYHRFSAMFCATEEAVVYTRLLHPPAMTPCRTLEPSGALGKTLFLSSRDLLSRLAAGTAIPVASLHPKGAVEFAHGLAWPGAETPVVDDAVPDEDLYQVHAVYSHRGRGQRLEFLVRYTHYTEKTWQPLSDFLDGDVCNLELLQYLRRRRLAESLGLA